MTFTPPTPTSDGMRAIALLNVSTSQAELVQARERRGRCFIEARAKGATWVQIGEASGLSPDGVRLLVARARRRES